MLRTSLIIIGFIAAAGLGACFIESPQPSTFRFSCESSEDCDAPEVCSDGLCQQPCGSDDDEDCPEEAPVCFNGYCSSACPVAETVCPEPQTCLALEDPNADEPAETGVCTVACDDQTRPCAEGQACFEGICLTSCVTDDECGNGESCLVGFCVPSFG